MINDWENFFTVAGGKWTTHRLIAEVVSDAVCDYLGVRARCRTAVEPVIEESSNDTFNWTGGSLIERGVGKKTDSVRSDNVSPRQVPLVSPSQLSRSIRKFGGGIARYVTTEVPAPGPYTLCFCESVPSHEISYAIERLGARTIDDVMRRTRAGFGPCQGSFVARRSPLS